MDIPNKNIPNSVELSIIPRKLKVALKTQFYVQVFSYNQFTITILNKVNNKQKY